MTDESSAPAANVREVVHPDPEQALWGFRHAPCFRESALWSIVIASVFSGVELYRKRPPYTIKNRLMQMSVPAAEAVFVGTFVTTSLGTWLLCRHQLRDRRDKMHEQLRFRSVNAEHQQRVAASGGTEACDACDNKTQSSSSRSWAPLGSSPATTAAGVGAARAHAGQDKAAASAPPPLAAAPPPPTPAPKAKSWWQLW